MQVMKLPKGGHGKKQWDKQSSVRVPAHLTGQIRQLVNIYRSLYLKSPSRAADYIADIVGYSTQRYVENNAVYRLSHDDVLSSVVRVLDDYERPLVEDPSRCSKPRWQKMSELIVALRAVL